VQTGDIRGDQVNALAGITRKLTPDLLVGAFGGYETFDYTSQLLSGRLKGEGWTVGGYVGWRFLTGLRFDAGVAYSGVDFDGSAGTAQGSFPGVRWLVSGGLTGTYKLGAFALEPSARVYALFEREDAYTDTLGTAHAERTFSNGRGSGGVKLTYHWMDTAAVNLAPYLGLYGDYYFMHDDAVVPGTTVAPPYDLLTGWSARVTGGISAGWSNGVRVTVGAEVGGLGSGQFTTWSGRGRISMPF
jgi:outer membrane autotransporter protein